MTTRPTRIANHEHPEIETLIRTRRWRALDPFDRIGAVYDFVRNEIPFGYNRCDDLPASEVLRDGYGQCNTKGNLLVALLRGSGLAARFHGFTIDKALQRGAIPELVYRLAPRRILHSWVEVELEGEWIALEGFILDDAYLRALQREHPGKERFCGYGVATSSLHSPEVEWRGRPTFIQREGIVDDFGLFEDPDTFYARHGTNLRGPRRWLYERVIRHWMNARVEAIRGGTRRRILPRSADGTGGVRGTRSEHP